VASGKAIATVIIAATIAAVLFNPLANVAGANSGTQHVTNETLSAQPGSYQDLNGYNIHHGETVYWENGSSYQVLSSPSDYSMKYTPGQIRINNSSSVASGDSIRVTYDYDATTGATTELVKVVPLLAAVLILGYLGRNVTKGR